MVKRSGFFAVALLTLLHTATSSAAAQADSTFPPNRSEADATFEIDDVVVSDPTDSLVDPEFDKNLASLRMAWQESTGELWVADVDPETGTWSPPDGRQMLVDTSAFLISETRQGPEWAYDDKGNRIVYTKEESGEPLMFHAWMDPATLGYVAEPMAWGDNQAVGKASEDPNDPRPRITFTSGEGDNETLRGWREIDDASTETLLPDIRKGRWALGLRALVGIREIRGIDQVFYYSLDTGRAIQITFDGAPKNFPVMWSDPATDQYLIAATMNDRRIGIWTRSHSGEWELANKLRPPTNIAYVHQLDPFTWKGASYLSYLMHTERSGERQNFTGTGEVWVTRVSGPGPFRHRQVNDPAVTRIKDPEPLPLGETVLIYYAEILDNQGYRRLIHRAATGL